MSDEELTKAIYEAMQVPYLSERHDAIKKLIKQHREAYALEAVIDELERTKTLYSRTYKQEVTDNVGNVYVNDSHGYISSYEVEDRIAKLKNQKDENI